MELERERGITIKAQSVRMHYRAKDGKDYVLNLIDTPGHVDFAYEVSRSLAACEGALLVVDAIAGRRGPDAGQRLHGAGPRTWRSSRSSTRSTCPRADVARTRAEIEDVIGIDASTAVPASAKEGIGIEEILEAVVQPRAAAARATRPRRSRPSIFDSWYDSYRGVVMLVRVLEGTLELKQKILLMVATRRSSRCRSSGVFAPFSRPVARLIGRRGGRPGRQREGDPRRQGGRHHHRGGAPHRRAVPRLQGSEADGVRGVFPIDAADYENLRDALEKLQLNDSAFTYEPETSTALGFGFRCGYLGLLHMEIVQERLEREYSLSLITTAPSVVYKVFTDTRARRC